MAWTIEYQPDSRIVEVRFSGAVSGPELKEAAVARIEFGKQKSAHRFLVDAAEMRASKSTILDVLEIPAKVYADSRMDRASNIAVIQPKDPESQWIAEFYENASVVRGWSVDVFSNRISATAWLQQH